MNAFDILNLKDLTMSVEAEIPTYKRLIRGSSDSQEMSIEIESIAILPSDYIKGTFTLAIDGFTQNHTATEAQTPQLCESFIIPNNADYSIVITEEEYVDYKLNLSPSIPEPAANSTTKPSIVPITEINKFLPENTITEISSEIFRGQKIINILINPVQYNSETKTARIFTKLTFTIIYLLPDNEIASYSLNTESNIKFPLLECAANYNLVVNTDNLPSIPIPDDSRLPYQSEPYKMGYLVIFDNDLRSEAERFISWKEQMGYKMYWLNYSKTDYAPAISALQRRIKSLCKRNPEICYLLFIGSHEVIKPIITSENSKNREIYTDMPYACIDGSGDNTPDLYYGRIPAKNLEEAKAAIDKIIAYGNGSDKIDGQSHFVSSAYFQDFYDNKLNEKPDGKEDRSYCKTAEIIALAAENKCEKVSRMYYYDPDSHPRYWYDSTQIPNYLLSKEYLSPKYNYQSVVDIINSGVSLFCHRDHGSPYGWVHPNISVYHLNKLNNTTYPILYSIDCLTGAFKEKQCFASTLLCQSNGGCASVIAATDTTYSGYNESFVLGMFKSLWPDQNIKYGNFWNRPSLKDIPKSTTLGEMVSVGNIQRNKTFITPKNNIDYLSYHILGDPSLPVYWNNKLDLKERVSLNFQGNLNFTVNVDGCRDAIISFHKGNLSFFKKGNKVDFMDDGYFVGIDSVYVTINARGAKPYCFYVCDWIKEHKQISTIAQSTPNVKIYNYSFSDGKLKIYLKGEITDNLSISLANGSLTRIGGLIAKEVNSQEQWFEINNPLDNLFHITLKYNNQEIDSKTILKR